MTIYMEVREKLIDPKLKSRYKNAFNILKLLDEGRKIRKGRMKNVILVLGNREAGKSIFTQFIASDYATKKSIMKYGRYNVNKNTEFSNAVFPKLIQNFENDVTFCDCPEFSDDLVQNITGKFFIKNIIDSANSLKLVFTVDYSLLEGNGKKIDCWSFLKHPIELINNMENFKNSIGIVVTNVARKLRKDDSVLLNNIKNILENCKEDIIKSIDSEDLTKNAIRFIDNLISQDDNNQNMRIGVFTRFDDLRSLTDITLLEADRNLLKNMLHNNMKFSTHGGNDFKCVIANSTEAEQLIKVLVDESEENITLGIKNISLKIQKYFYDQEKQSRNIDDLYKIFNLSFTTLSITQTSILNCNDIECFKEKITEYINNSNITTFNKDFSNIDTYIEFLRCIHPTRENSSKLWSEGLTDLLKYLYDSKIWYSFLIVLDDTFAEYDVQKYIQSTYITYPRGMINQILANEKNEVRIKEESSSEIKNILRSLKSNFFNRLNTHSFKELEKISNEIGKENVTLNLSKIKFLNIILDQALKYSSSISCEDNNNLVLKGNYLMLSSVLRAKCRQAKFVKIFALKKFYLDTMYNRTGDEVKLFIIAPEWDFQYHAMENCYIILNGQSSIDSKQYSRIEETPKRSVDAGDFVGISQEDRMPNSLSVCVTGGLTDYTKDSKEDGCTHEMKEKFFNYKDSRWTKICKTELLSSNFPYSEGTCYLYPMNCSSRAGRGRTGYYIIVTSDLQSNIKLYDTVGIKDEQFITPDTMYEIGKKYLYYNSPLGFRRFLPEKACESLQDMKDGRCVEFKFIYSVFGDTLLKMLYLRDFDMKQKTTTVFDILPTVINNYKRYARENLINSIREPSLTKFLNQIDKNDLYNTLGFVNELQDLEEQFYRLRKDISLLPFYQSLLDRVVRYENKLQNFDKSTQEYDKNILLHLRTAILSKNYFQNYAKNEFFRNLPMYLDELINDLNKMINLHDLTLKYNYKQNYTLKHDTKIREAYSLITDYIMPQINNTFTEIEKEINLLFLESNETMHKIKEEKEKLIEYRKLVVVHMIGKTLFTFAKLAAVAFFFLGPYGILIGLGAEGILTTVEELDNKKPSPVKRVKLPSGVTKAFREENDTEKRSLFKQHLNETRAYLDEKIAEDRTVDLIRVKSKISDTLEKLKNEDEKSTSLDQESIGGWHTYKTDVADTIKQRIDILKEDNAIDTIHREKQLRILYRAQIGVSMGQKVADYAMSVKDDVNEIGDINDAIEIADAKEYLLEEYEKIMHKVMIPMNHKVKADIENAIKRLVDASEKDLVKTKIKIKNILKNANMKWKEMTEDFNVRDQIIHCFEKLEYAVTEIFRMYDDIKHYQEVKTLADYITNITVTQKFHQISEISDSTLKDLTSIIQSNLVLNKYEISINAFKHEVFPFAHYYLKDIDLSLVWKHNETYESMNKIVEVVEQLKKKLEKFRRGMHDYRTLMHPDVTFGCNSTNIQPFYVWEYDRNKRDILNLLEGKEVVLKSDIGYDINSNAVKFNVIRIRFSLKNKSKQDDFDRVLERFEVTMKHLGTSYYRCDNKFYKISTTDTDVFTYFYNTNCHVTPESPNGIYLDTAKYYPVLSPYAIWSIRLTKKVTSNDYNELSYYKDEVMDLLLEGKGEYLSLNLDVCNDNLSDYYVEDDSINFVDFGTDTFIEYMNNEKNVRRRRDVNQNIFISSIEKSSSASNGGCNSKPSIINNVLNLIGSSLGIFRYWMPISNVSQWFINYKENVSDEKQLSINTNHHSSIHILDSQFLQKVFLRIPNILLDNESPTGNTLNPSLFLSNANLLFLDSVIRWKNGNKHKQQYRIMNNDLNVQYSHNLAYKAQKG